MEIKKIYGTKYFCAIQIFDDGPKFEKKKRAEGGQC